MNSTETTIRQALKRRRLLQAGLALGTAGALPGFARASAPDRVFALQPGAWRTFEMTLSVDVADAQGGAKLWLPLPDVETDYQRTIGHVFAGNAAQMKIVADVARGTRMLYAEFPATLKNPQVQLTSRFQTRSRAVDWSKPGRASEDPALLKACTGPTELQPIDGIVRKTALAATQGAKTDLDKVRAIYAWVVKSAHREPKTRGCGTGDIRTMLETGNLSGKCADLNALFVGLCRAVGVPARDVYGLRLAPSAFGYRELGAGNPANLKAAQHCRAEVFLQQYGWVGMDPADVLKVMRQETSEWIKDAAHPLVAPVNKGLFGGWEGNWVAYNTAHDLMLPGSSGRASLPFLMYPQGENASGRFDELAPDAFKYTIAAKEIVA